MTENEFDRFLKRVADVFHDFECISEVTEAERRNVDEDGSKSIVIFKPGDLIEYTKPVVAKDNNRRLILSHSELKQTYYILGYDEEKWFIREVSDLIGKRPALARRIGRIDISKLSMKKLSDDEDYDPDLPCNRNRCSGPARASCCGCDEYFRYMKEKKK